MSISLPEPSDSPSNNSIIDELRTLRDEARVQIHLAGMDLKEVWSNLEYRLDEAEQKIGQAADSSLSHLNELKGQVEAFLKKLPSRGATADKPATS